MAQNITTNKQNQLKITKETLISIFCCSCVRLLVNRFTFNIKKKDHGEMVHISFIKQYNLCDCRFHRRRAMFWLYSLRYTYAFKIHVCTNFKQGIWADQIHLQ